VATLNIEKYIDHTALKADLEYEDIKKLCEEARKYGFYSVCVNPTWVATCRDLLNGSDVEICTVIGFPLGATTPDAKAYETKNAIENGATEVDMVINIGALKDGNDQLVLDDIRAVVEEARGKALIKVIIETSLLTKEEKVRACKLSVQAEADYVKTSTGFSTGGATVEDIKLMREVVGPEIGVKASGGVRNKESAEEMIAAGATRIGASTGVAIMEGKVAVSQY
jgi:deoxyribose-phosphate aldolase